MAKTKMFDEKAPEVEDELPGNCARYADFTKVYDNKLYEVSDLHISDGEGNIACTITSDQIAPGSTDSRERTRL